MTTHFKGHRIASARLAGWDYGRPVWYFITICLRNRLPCLARVEGARVALSPVGEVVARCWRALPTIRPEVKLGAWVVMPEHFHALVRPCAPPPANHAGPGLPPGIAPEWRPATLGVLINQFKRAVTLELKQRGIPWVGWQPRYHDRIVRDTHALHAITRYIEGNPARYHAGPPGGLTRGK